MLVMDIEQYPKFLPYCSGAKVHSSTATEVLASIEVAKAGQSYGLTTKNRIDAPHSIIMQLSAGPFKQLQGTWSFKETDAGNSTIVSISVEFTMHHKILQWSLRALLPTLLKQVTAAFAERAKILYAGLG